MGLPQQTFITKVCRHLVFTILFSLTIGFAFGTDVWAQIPLSKMISSTNVALNKPATQSSTLPTQSTLYGPCNPTADKAVDGGDDGNVNNCSVSSSSGNEPAWWQVDLEHIFQISRLVIYNNTTSKRDSLNNIVIKLSEDGIKWTSYPKIGLFKDQPEQNPASLGVNIPNMPFSYGVSLPLREIPARYVRIEPGPALFGGDGRSLSIADVQVMSSVIAIPHYVVGTHGWTFANFGEHGDDADDLTNVDLIQMFGAKAVCMTGTTAADCQLFETAEEWKQEALKRAQGGHCLGMSVSSLRLLEGVSFRNKKTPGDWLKDADATGKLKRNSGIDNYITYFQVLQARDEVWSKAWASRTKAPSETTKYIASQIQTTQRGYRPQDRKLIAFAFWQPGHRRGHAVVPYMVADLGGDKYRIYVYDNNYPNDPERYVSVDAKAETWSYRTASNPAESAYDYVGSKDSQTLATVQISDFDQAPYSFPAAIADESAGGAGVLRLSLTREGNFVVKDSRNRSEGFDPVQNRLFDEIPNALIQYPIDAPLGEDAAPVIEIPISETQNQPLTVTLFGNGIRAEEDEDLEITGPGFVVGFEDILLDPDESLMITASPDGKQLSFTTSADGQTPTIYFATDSGHDQPSYLFHIGGVEIKGGTIITATLDLQNGRIFFRDNDGRHERYTIRMTRLNPDGTRDEFEEDDIDIGSNDSIEMDFGKWDGKGTMDFEDDENGDGVFDEAKVSLVNQAKPR